VCTKLKFIFTGGITRTHQYKLCYRIPVIFSFVNFCNSTTMTSQQQQHPSTIGIAPFIFLVPTAISFAVYLNTTSKAIAGGDSGELVAEGCSLGTAHPPGYPLFTLIVYVVTTMGREMGGGLYTPAYLVNVTCCVFGSLASGLISMVVFELTDNNVNVGMATATKTASKKQAKAKSSMPMQHQRTFALSISRFTSAISAGLLCSFSPLMWQYNTSAEVFALHNLFVSLIAYVLTIYTKQSESTSILSAGAFLCGLSMTNQHTSILIIIPVIVWVFFKSSVLRKPKLLLISSVSFLLGFSLYVLLPITAKKYPHAGSWGEVTKLEGFIHHLLRRDYGTLRLYSGSSLGTESMVTRTMSWVHDLACNQLGNPMVTIFLLIGFVSTCTQQHSWLFSRWIGGKTSGSKKTKAYRATDKVSRRNDAGKVISVALVFYLVCFHSLSNLPLSNQLLFGVHQRFWMHPNILCFVLIGRGLCSFTSALSRISSKTSIVVSMFLLLLPMRQYHQNFDISDQSTNRYFHSYAMSILEPLPSSSLLFINYDQQWTSIRYLQECEMVRTDVTSINLR
jgi:hypothetical protein